MTERTKLTAVPGDPFPLGLPPEVDQIGWRFLPWPWIESWENSQGWKAMMKRSSTPVLVQKRGEKRTFHGC